MDKKRKTRGTRPCSQCEQEVARLYRVVVDASARWVFVCDACWPRVQEGNPHYRYGGTWTDRKRR